MAFVEDVTTKATTYLGYAPKALDIDLAIETFKDIRNYPKSYDNEQIESDLELNINKVAMAVVEYDAKEGVEGQESHSENGINRTYGKSFIPKAYSTVIPFATIVS